MTEPFRCTKENPWKLEVTEKMVLHPDATIIADTPEGAIVRGCPNCGMRWINGVPEMPQ